MPDGPVDDPVEPRLWLVEEHTSAASDQVDDRVPPVVPSEARPGRFHTDVRASAARHPAGGTGVEGLPAEPPDDTRLAIVRMELSGAADSLTATVTLRLGGLEHVGAAEGASDEGTVHRTIARATARAVGAALGDAGRLDIGDVVVAALGADRVAVVQVRWVEPVGSERLTGVATAPDDVRAAVIRATLDAVNRRLSPELAR